MDHPPPWLTFAGPHTSPRSATHAEELPFEDVVDVAAVVVAAAAMVGGLVA